MAASLRATIKRRPIRVGYLRVLNAENTIVACLLSVAPVLDHVAVIWADMADRSIDLIREWEGMINRLGCTISYAHYPHHVVGPHSLADISVVPVENRFDTYTNFGIQRIQDMFDGMDIVVSKIDSDQVYFAPEFRTAFDGIKRPDACIFVHGYGTVVHDGRLMLNSRMPVECVREDTGVCGKDNLPLFDINWKYEIDVRLHPRVNYFHQPVGMHFQSRYKCDGVIREYREKEDGLEPLTQHPAIAEVYRRRILPFFRKSGSPYADLRLD